MKKFVMPSDIQGEIEAPASKSDLQRMIAIAMLAKGQSVAKVPAFSEDVKAALNIASEFGADVKISDGKLILTGNQLQFPRVIQCGESGLSARMFSAIAATFSYPVRIEGKGSLLKRPQYAIVDTLSQIGAQVQSSHGYLPLEIQGPIKGGKIAVDGSFTSQVLSGLLIALPLINENTEMKVKNLISKPYIDVTLNILKQFQIHVENIDYQTFLIQGKQRPMACECEMGADWSGVAFHLVAAAINGEATLNMESTSSVQGDRNILQVLHNAGAEIAISSKSIHVARNPLKAFRYDATHTPDLFPPLVVLGMNAKGTSEINGVHRLLHKESNRAEVLQNEFAKVGGKIRIEGDSMFVEGGKIKGGKLDSNNDHRIAMAGAVAALSSEEGIEIENAESIRKSYPDFFQDLEALCKH